MSKQTYTHYTVHSLDSNGRLARGMYTVSDAYDTVELARELGPQCFAGRDPGLRLAITRVETQDADSRDGAYRRLVRETILELL